MSKVAVVTGSNKGIGLEIVKGLLAKLPSPSTVVLCSRDMVRGEAAVKEVSETASSHGNTVVLMQLDITDGSSISNFASRVKNAYEDGLDILVNNAGFAFKSAAPESTLVQATETLKINFYGTRDLCQVMLPMMKENGRVVNVGSRAGLVGKWGKERAKEILSPVLTEDELNAIAMQYVNDVEAGNNLDKGWPNTTYGTSKALVHALTRIHARDIASHTTRSGVTVNAMCPGWCKSDMAGWEKPPRTAAEGADTAVWLATTPECEATGSFFADRQEISWK